MTTNLVLFRRKKDKEQRVKSEPWRISSGPEGDTVHVVRWHSWRGMGMITAFPSLPSASRQLLRDCVDSQVDFGSDA
jgi:hypothetical protein